MKLIFYFSLLLFIIKYPIHSQAKDTSNSNEDLLTEISRLKKDLEQCRKGKSLNRNDSKVLEAIASLKAVKSAIDAGANFNEFKKYHIESKIKIDELPDNTSNRNIKEISDIYSDAVTFGIFWITGNISKDSINRARSKYKDENKLVEILDKHSNFEPHYWKDYGQLIYQILIRRADKKISVL